MKIGFIYGPFCLGGEHNGFDFGNLWDDPRGLTGSELSFARIAQEIRALGHDVHIFTFPRPGSVDRFGEIPVHRIDRFVHEARAGGWDAFCSWNEAEVFRDVPGSAVRLVNLQINSVGHCFPGFDDLVDVWLSPSAAHRERMLRDEHLYGEMLPPGQRGMFRWRDASKWEVLTNGCDPGLYGGRPKVPGRVVWASSPDRGLHWLLSCWPRIRREVPHAHLRIFYKIRPWFAAMEETDELKAPFMSEQIRRARYIREALRRLEGHGVELMHSVSRNRMVQEMSEAEVLAYPCDTVNWTEGFSVTLMEACAAGSVPVTTDVDALGSIYGGHIPVIRSPVGERLDEFAGTVAKALKDPGFRDSVKAKAAALADAHRWPDIAVRLESLIAGRIRPV